MEDAKPPHAKAAEESDPTAWPHGPDPDFPPEAVFSANPRPPLTWPQVTQVGSGPVQQAYASPRAPAPEPTADWLPQADAHDLADPPHRPGPLQRFGRLIYPGDGPPDEAAISARDRRWTSRCITVIALMLLVFNSASIRSWVTTLEPNWATETLGDLTEIWEARLAELGADQPRARVRAAYEDLRGRTFGPAESPPPV
ncbi:MAG TPA: hypothetical protein VGB49_06050 [Caulobacteraceae bacterium]|jgi:hypothetical protein